MSGGSFRAMKTAVAHSLREPSASPAATWAVIGKRKPPALAVAARTEDAEDAAQARRNAAMEAIRAFRESHRLNGLSIRSLIEEGRR